MNKIFKVIWSKSRNCYVVASELAKGHTKASSTGDKTRRLALAAITALMLLPVGGYSYAADDTIMVEPVGTGSTTAVEVYTKEGIDTGMESLQQDIQKFNQQVQASLQESQESLKANADAINEEARKRKYSVTNLENVDKQLQTNIDNEAAAREAADTEIKQAMTDQKTSTALHISSSGDLIVGTKENQTVKDMEIRGQLASGSISTGDITSTGNVKVSGKVEAEAVYDDTTKTGNYVVQTTSVGANLSALDTQVKSNADAIEEEARKRKYSVTNLENADKQLQTNIDNEAAAREAKDNELNERITNEANAIHETTNKLQDDLNTETADRKAADAALDSRTTALEAKTEAITYDKDSKTVMVDGKLTATEGITDGTTQDGQYVKADNYVGQNLNALDQGLQAETTARKAADTALDDKITAETSARVAADAKLVEAVNSGLSLSNDNVLQKNTTTIDAQGNVTTSKTDANEMILNKGKDNQITLNENGIKVGTNSSVMDANGVYTGGDTYSEAKAAMSADGKIKGANGAFTVDENGNVTSKATITGETVTDGKGASMSNGTVTGKTLTDGIATITNGNINTSGTITGGTVTSTGNISALGDIHAGGAITGASASIQGALTAGSATITGDLTAGGAIQGKSISDGTATMQNGNLTGVKNLSAETITTSGDATIGGDLTVNGKLNVDEIDLTTNGIVGDNNVTASTKVAAGEITSYQKATSTKDGSEKESAIDYDENGTSIWAKATDADGNWKKSTLTVEGSDVTSKVVDSDKNSNESKRTSTESSDVVKDADGNTSTFSQRVKDILQEIKNASSDTLTKVEQTDTSITSQIGDGSAVKSEMTADGITNTAVGGTITNSAKDLVNTATGDMTNTVGGKMLNDVTGDMENKVGGELKTTVTGKVTEDYKSDLDTKVGGNQTTTVTGDSSLTAENITNEAKNKITNKAKNGTIANDAKDITNNVAENMTNTVGKNLTTTVGGNQTTTVTGDSSLSANNISNTATTSITNKVGDNVSTTMSTDSIVNKVGKTTITTTDGKTKLSNEDGTHVTEMDYADVMKDLGVRGNATVDGDTTLGKEGADTKLTVNSKSTFKDTVKLEKTLEVDGTSTFNNKVTVTKGGLDVNGGTTTDTLHVTSTSTFDGAATFKDIVTMEKDLSVGGNATVAGSMTASSYKVGDKTYIDSNGINANNQKIVNVAAGDLSASSTDAVNGTQLYQTNERVASVENRVDTVENRVSNLDSRVDKVGANTAALANLHPLEFDADSKWNIAAAVGGYKGETATAIGAFYRPNENVMVNVSSSFGTGENMYGGGISLRIGQGGNKARRNATNGLTDREKAMQKQIDSLTNRLDALLSVINPNMSKDFPDVPENHWAYEAVSRLAGNGVIQGYEDGKYHGDRTMTRYEMAEIIYNALSKGAKAEKKLVEEFKPELQAMAAQKKA